MTKTYFKLFAVLCLCTLASCSHSYRFKTIGLPENTSSYLVTKGGRHVNADKIKFKNGKVKADQTFYPLDSLSIIKSKKSYFILNNNTLYLTEVYGKLNLLFTIQSYTSWANSGAYGSGSMHTVTTTTKTYYLHKQDSTAFDEMNKETLLRYVAGNEDAVKLAKSYYTWKHITEYGTVPLFAGSLIYTATKIGDNTTLSTLKGPLSAVVASIFLYSVSTTVTKHKLPNAIATYNAGTDGN